eukprot:gene660-1112_t
MGAAMIGDLEKDILTGTITKTAISKLKVATIREELRKRGLDDKGLKGDLVVRFYEAALAPPEQPPTPLPKQEKAPREQLEQQHEEEARGGGTGRPVVKFGVVRGREGEGKWPLVEDEDGVCVHAAHLEHKVECFGYAIQERDSPGMLQPDREGLAVTAPNGRVIQPDEVVGPPRPGRRAIILGDTCDPWMITSSAMQADVIVHEATFHEGHRNMAVKAGHSTAHMAGLFAHNIQSVVKAYLFMGTGRNKDHRIIRVITRKDHRIVHKASALILTHFSARYDGYQDAAEEEDSFLPQKALKDFDFSIDGLVQEARHAFHGKKVMAAHDFFRVIALLLGCPEVEASGSHAATEHQGEGKA